MNDGPRTTDPVILLPLGAALLLGLLLLLTSSAQLLTGTSDPAKIESIINSTHMRGCVYTRASGLPWASVTSILIGTWGDPPMDIDTCWRAAPMGLP